MTMTINTSHSHLGAGLNVIGNKFHFCPIIFPGDIFYDQGVSGLGSVDDVGLTFL